MAGPVTDAHRIMFRDNFIMALQEKRGMFDDAFTSTEELKGKQVQLVDIIGAVDAIEDAPEGGDTPDIKPSHEPVWVRPKRLIWGQLMSGEDPVKGLTVPNSTYIQGGVAGIIRKKNIHYANALLGNRLIGNENPTETAWAGTTVAAGGANLTVDKFSAALTAFQEADVEIDDEEIFCAASPAMLENLTKDAKFTSKDYRNRAVLEEKRVKEFMGVRIIVRNSLTSAIFWCKSGMVAAPFHALSVVSQPNPAKQYREHPFAETWIAASRIEDKKVVRVAMA